MSLTERELLAIVLVGGAVLILAEPAIEQGVKTVVGGLRAKDYDQLVQAVAVNYNFDPNILRAIVMQESTWNPNAVSRDGLDIGLAGIRYGKGPNVGTAELFVPEFKWLTDDQIKEKLFNPQINLDLAGRVIAELTRHGLGSVPDVFHAYNVGETKFRHGIRSPTAEKYVAYYNGYTGGPYA